MATERAFPTSKAAVAAGISIGRIHCWLRQGVIAHCGIEPRASYPREYPLVGVYELSLLDALTRGGVERSAAIGVTRELLRRALAAGTADEPLPGAYDAERRIVFEHRDTARSAILVVAADGRIGDSCTQYELADGWGDLPRATERIQRAGRPQVLAAEAPWSAEVAPEAPRARQSWPVLLIADVTSILVAVDERIAAMEQS